jgi:hypothetical protein
MMDFTGIVISGDLERHGNAEYESKVKGEMGLFQN